MGLEQFDIFEAEGESLRIAMDWQARRDAANEARKAFAKAIALDALVIGTDDTFFGVSTRGPVNLDAWREAKIQVKGATMPCWEPNKKTKAGKALAKALSDPKFRVPGSSDLSSAFKFSPFMTPVERGYGMSLHYLQGQRVGERMILFVPNPKRLGAKPGRTFAPEGRPMRLSEYHRLIEEQQDLEAARA